MPADSDYVDYVFDCFAAARVGPVTRERLFSGSGLRIDGELFGVILRGTLYFVVDDQSRPRFVEAGMGPFTYSRKTEQRRIERWYELPEDVLLDPADLRDWVHEALAASRRTAKPSPKKKTAVRNVPVGKADGKTASVRKMSVKKPGTAQSAKTGVAEKAAARGKTSVRKSSGRTKTRPAR